MFCTDLAECLCSNCYRYLSSAVPGTVTLHEQEYVEPNNYPLILTATNAVTESVQTISETIKVLYGIVNPSVQLSQPLILHPDDLIEFTVSVDRGSQMQFNMSCTDTHSVGVLLRSSIVLIQ